MAEGSPDAKTRLRLSLSLRRKKTELAPSSRFVVVSDTDVIKAAEGVDPENTSRVNAWGLRKF